MVQSMIIQNTFVMHVAGEDIAGIVASARDDAASPRCVLLHGAGQSVKETAFNLLADLIVPYHGIVTLDFSGHGQSSGNIKKSSLKRRVEEARTIIDRFADGKQLVLIGSSMGGYIAVKLLELYPVATLILFCPALYDAAAYDVRFDSGFTEILRRPESWRDTDAIPLLRAFKGKLLVIMGQEDAVIPAGVTALFDEHVRAASKKEIYTIPHCPHKIDEWIMDKPEELARLRAKILEYIA